MRICLLMLALKGQFVVSIFTMAKNVSTNVLDLIQHWEKMSHGFQSKVNEIFFGCAANTYDHVQKDIDSYHLQSPTVTDREALYQLKDTLDGKYILGQTGWFS